jgi:hypothetical protein
MAVNGLAGEFWEMRCAPLKLALRFLHCRFLARELNSLDDFYRGLQRLDQSTSTGIGKKSPT